MDANFFESRYQKGNKKKTREGYEVQTFKVMIPRDVLVEKRAYEKQHNFRFMYYEFLMIAQIVYALLVYKYN